MNKIQQQPKHRNKNNNNNLMSVYDFPFYF